MSEAAYLLDGRPIDRPGFYAVACDPKRSVIVEACAGAGKTWMLVSRILRALLEGAAPNEILAITFTRKAAGEMRSRLDEWLTGFASTACGDDVRVAELRARGVAEAEARALAPALGRLHERLLELGRPVEVRTFHAWFSQLLRAAPLELLSQQGLHREMELVEDITVHFPAVFRRFHAALLRDDALRADFDTMVRLRGRSQVRKWLEVALDKRVEIELADRSGRLVDSVAEASHLSLGLAHPGERIRHPTALSHLRDLAIDLGRSKGAVSKKQAVRLEHALLHETHGPCLAGVRKALLTDRNTLRKGLDAPGLSHAIDLLTTIAADCAQHEAQAEHACMVRLSRLLFAEFMAYKKLRGLADMADLELCALTLLRDGALSGWVQERLDARIRHLLIDEFQDTSPLQWHALRAWLEGYAGAGGGASGQKPPGVFIVGDPKQSIYRFRRAEPRVFEQAREFVREGLGGSVLACDHTRRNAPEVIESINRVFAQAQQAGEFEGFRSHTTEVARDAGSRAGVLALPRVERPDRSAAETRADNLWRDTLTTPRHEPEEVLRRREADEVGRAIHALIRDGARPGDIYVLCRKRESLRLAAEALAALHLPFAAAEDFGLMEAPEVRDLVALLDVLVSPQHDLSLAQALRSPVFGASDDDLIAIAEANVHTGGWWRTLMTMEPLSAPLARARRLFRGWAVHARELPPHDLLDIVVAEGEVVERYAAAVPPERRAAALAAIDALLAQALVLDGGRYATPYNFVRTLKSRPVGVAAALQADAVKLLTVHGAKGLEARVVFVMDTDPTPKSGETATVLIDWPVEAAAPRVCAFVYSESQCPPSLDALLDRELAARRREELNGLYVAMSRAKERLVFSATAPHRPSPDGPSWWARVTPLAEHWAPPDAVGRAHADTPFSLRVLPIWAGRPSDPVDPSAPDDAAAGPASAAATRRLGEAVHRVLEWAASADPAAVDIAALAAAAAAEFSVDRAAVRRLSGSIWHSEACAPFFRGPGIRWTGNEVTVVEGGDVLRIDRLVCIEGHGGLTWWVIDYKLQHRPEEVADYRLQMARYARAVQALQPADVVRCAFITAAGEVNEITEAG